MVNKEDQQCIHMLEACQQKGKTGNILVCYMAIACKRELPKKMAKISAIPKLKEMK